jgi:imidazolonepropionase-like amidohydrolase
MGCHPSASVAPVVGPALVFDDVRVFDGEADLGVTDVVVRDDVIVSLGQVDLSTPIAGIEVVDGRGKTLLPGLIDGHAHVASISQLEQAAAFGVTTVLDMFMDEVTMRAIKRQQAKGKLADAADLRSAGILATAPGGHGTEYGVVIPTIERADQAEAWVAERVEAGVDYIKVVYDDGHAAGVEFGNFDPPTLAAVIAAAHAHDRRAVVHVSDLAAAKQALRAGADGLAHVWFDQRADEEVLSLAREHDAFVVATLVVMQTACGDRLIRAASEDPELVALVDPLALANLVAVLDANHGTLPCSTAAETVGQLHAAGIDLIAGTDIPNFGLPAGFSLHADLALLVAAGLTPAEALRAATKTPAERFGLSDRGTIAPGARADLLLVDGDPLADITATRHIAGVWKAGRAIDLAEHRSQIADAHAALEARKSAPPPPGSSSGLISDFETDLSVRFGLPWETSTDAIAGGSSTVGLDRVEGGVRSTGALRMQGVVAEGPRGWAGANFFPDGDRKPVNLSSKHVLRFWARGTPGEHAVLFFASSPIPVFASFELADPSAWIEVEIDLDALRVPTWDLMLVFIGATTPGAFELQIDEVRLD